MITEKDRKFWLEEFKNFLPPENFIGGCVRTRGKTVDGLSICVLLRADGTISQIKEGCENEINCKGLVYKYKP